ncbi:MAG: hypothetical protein NTV34_14465, partial [Proteobacteria bacterium]|nr:hypothetical protein [Pseudomonadota bacterium]
CQNMSTLEVPSLVCGIFVPVARITFPLFLEWHRGQKSPQSIAMQIFAGESPDKRDFSSLTNFSSKCLDSSRLPLLTHTHTSESYRDRGIEVHPLRG